MILPAALPASPGGLERALTNRVLHLIQLMQCEAGEATGLAVVVEETGVVCPHLDMGPGTLRWEVMAGLIWEWRQARQAWRHERFLCGVLWQK